MKTFDLVILGSGPGGYVAALYAAKLGQSVCVIEKDLIGGTCLNRGCIPTKVMLHAASILRRTEHSAAYGISANGVTLNEAQLFKQRNTIVTRLREGIQTLFKLSDITLLRGRGRLAGNGAVDVDGTSVKAKHIIIATGSRPFELSTMKFDGHTVLSSEDILASETMPESLLVVGGGVIGCEFAQFYNTLGKKVVIVELLDRLLPGMDREISKKLELIFKKEGISVITSKKITGLKKEGGGVTATLSDSSTIHAQKALISVGRAPNIEDIGLEAAGVTVEKSKIVVNKRLATSARNIWAIGDVIQAPMLAHAASYEAIIACDNIAGGQREVDFNRIPNCIYTDPGIATVGSISQDGQERHGGARTVKFPYRASGKAHILGMPEGFIKITGDNSGALLGVEIFGEDAYELIGEASLAIALGASIEEIAHTVHGHPTLSEIFQEAAHLFLRKPIHTM